jgi:hypothetical protein
VNVPRLVQSWNRFILQQIYSQCAGSLDKFAPDESAGDLTPIFNFEGFT